MKMARKPKPGRPSLPTAAKKGKIMGVRFRPAERTLLEEAAASQRQTLSAWMRETLLHAASRQAKRPAGAVLAEG